MSAMSSGPTEKPEEPYIQVIQQFLPVRFATSDEGTAGVIVRVEPLA